MSKCCIIKSNTPELRQRLEQSGISVCICSSFKEADWLCCWESNMAYDVHGVYPDGIDDLSKEAYYKQVLDSWKKLKFNGWYGCSGGDYSKETWKYFVSRVDSLIDAYSDEETVCADRPEA